MNMMEMGKLFGKLEVLLRRLAAAGFEDVFVE